MNNSKIIQLGLIGLGVIGIIVIISSFVSFSNNEINLRNTFEQKFDERTAFYDKMYKIVAQQTQIAVKNDNSFKEVVNAQVTGQKNGEQVMWAWVQQSNPTATYGEVSKLYEALGRAVEAQREGFFIQEKVIQDVVRQHKNLIQTFPGSFYNIFFGREKLVYTPIKSTLTEQVIKTGKDDNVKLDL